MAADESVIINTLLVGAREFAANVQVEVASLGELADAAGLTAKSMESASAKTFVANQALFTTRRVAYAGTLALLAAGAAAIKLGWNYSSAMQQASVALAPVFKSTAALNKELNYLYKFSSFTPFQFKDVTVAFRQMYAAFQPLGLSLQTTNETLKSITDALSFAGRTTPSALNRVSVALQHMAYLGHLTGQVVLQLARDGLPIYAALTKELGLTGDQVHNIGKLGITSAQALGALNKYIETTPGFMNAAMRQSLMTLHGAFTTFKDFLSQAVSGGEGGLFTGLKNFFEGVDKALAPLVNSGKPITFNDFITAIDQVLSPKSHLVLDFFNLLAGVVQGVTYTVHGLITAIDLVLWPLDQFGGGGHGAQVAFKALGIVLGTYLGLLGLFKTYTLLAALAVDVWTAALFAGRVAMALYGIVVGIVTGAEWLWNAAMLATSGEMIVMEGLWSGLTVAAFLTALQMSATTIALGLWDAAVGLADIAAAGFILSLEGIGAAFVALDALLGPVGWIMLAIAGLVILYQRWAAFRNIVNETFNWIKDHWKLLGLILVAPFAAVTLLIARNFGQIETYVKNVLGWISGKVGSVASEITRLWNKIPGHGLLGGIAKHIPGLAAGGSVMMGGLTMVGENGPELLSLPAGATVIPLQGGSDYGLGNVFQGLTIKVYPQDIYLDGKKVATAIATAVTDTEARQ